MIPASEFPLNEDGSVYHLHLQPEQIADTVILVGDPGRVKSFANFFDKIEYEVQNREIFTSTGIYKGKKLSIMSTGMGTDNLDICINELDALVNIDLKTREEKVEKKSLNLVRIGTCGSLVKDIEPGNFIVSRYGMGMDGLMNFYKTTGACEEKMLEAFEKVAAWLPSLPRPYFVKSSDKLFNKVMSSEYYAGITATASGFYAPQGRVVRLPLTFPELHDELDKFEYDGLKITNLEMETSALYGLGKALGHNCLTACLIVANRVNKTFLTDYKKVMMENVEKILDKIV
ncbi:MAG: nucleoside phosphorylase [Bacteroidales bacterium]|jgi:uridine phosphorylase|nr:nucleoside phosphorylase [Bacteroidales bacterium]